MVRRNERVFSGGDEAMMQHEFHTRRPKDVKKVCC